MSGKTGYNRGVAKRKHTRGCALVCIWPVTIGLNMVGKPDPGLELELEDINLVQEKNNIRLIQKWVGNN